MSASLNAIKGGIRLVVPTPTENGSSRDDLYGIRVWCSTGTPDISQSSQLVYDGKNFIIDILGLPVIPHYIKYIILVNSEIFDMTEYTPILMGPVTPLAVASYTEVTGTPSSLSDINNTEGTKLTNIESGATRQVFLGNWSQLTSYVLGDCIIHNGYGWKCILGHANQTPPAYPSTSNTYWSLVNIKGYDALSVENQNSTHSFTTDSAGAVLSYVGSGTNIVIYQGGTRLDYAGTGTATVNGTWKITSTSNTNITVGTLTGESGDYAIVGDHGSFTNVENTASISYNINGITKEGEVFNLTTTQTFSKSKTGTSGINTAPVYLYKSNTSTVTPPAAFTGTFTYTFATNALSGGTLNGWVTTVPALAAGEFLWVRQAVASSNTATDTIAATEFSAAVVTNGVGTNGTNTAIVPLYYKNTSSSVAPTNTLSGTFTYTFATNALSDGTLNGWTTTVPTLAAGEYIWVRQAIANSNTATDTIAATEFSAAVVTNGVGTNGTNGTNGINTAPVYLYKSNTSTVTPPAAFTGTFTYTFATNALSDGTLNGWVTTVPALAAGEFLWVRQAVASSNTATDTIAATEFSAAVVTNGVGTNGTNTAIVPLYYKNTSSSVAPTNTLSGTFTYTFATNALSDGTLNGWTTTVPTLAAGEFLWVRQAIANSNTATDTIAATEFSAAVVTNGVGATGNTGLGAIYVILSNETHSIPTDSAGNNGVYTGSGTTVRVYEGSTELSFESTAFGTTTANTSWRFNTVVGSSITVGTITDSGSFATIGTASGITADTANITYTINGKRSDGTVFSGIIVQQSFSRLKQGSSVIVTTNRAASFTATDGGLDTAQADIAFTATVTGVTSPTYVWSFSGLQTNPTASTTNTQTITAEQFGTSKSAIITCTVSGTYVDKVTVVRLEKSSAAAGATVGATWDTNLTNIPHDKIYSMDAASTLGFNPSFEYWTSTYPVGWSAWNTAPTKDTSIVRYGSNSAKFVVPVATNAGMTRTVSWATQPLPLKTSITGSVDIYLVSRVSGLPGMLVRLFTNSALTTFIDTPVQPNSTLSTWQRVPFTARVQSTEQIYGIQIYIMGSYVGFGSGLFEGTCYFDGLVFNTVEASTDASNVSLSTAGALTVNSTALGTVSITGLGYTGALDANKTYVDSSGNIQGVSSGAGTTVNNALIDVGGTNLLANSLSSNFASILSGPVTVSLESIALPDGSTGSALKLVTGTVASSIRVTRALRSNDTYSFSVYHRGTTASTSTIDFADYNSSSITHSTSWQYYTKVGYLVTNWTYATYHFIDITTTANTTIYLWHPKNEYGNKCTDWTPAPEDALIGLNAYTGALDATKGAPSGTYVGSTLAQTVDTNASTALIAATSITNTSVIGEVFNGTCNISKPDGTPAGVFAMYGGSTQADITFQDVAKTIVKLKSTTSDTSTGMAWAAFRVVPTSTYNILIRVKSSNAAASGFYFRMYEYDSDLAAGVYYIHNGTGVVGGVTGTRTISTFREDQAITTSWVDFNFTYTPTSTAKWVSPYVLNWDGMGDTELHVEKVIITSNANTTYVDGSGNIQGVSSGAGTAVNNANAWSQLATGTFAGDKKLYVGTTTTGILIDGGSTDGVGVKVQDSGVIRARMGYLPSVTIGGAVTAAGYGFAAFNNGNLLFDSRNAVGLLGNTTYDNYNVGDDSTNLFWNTNAGGMFNIAIGAGALGSVTASNTRSNNICIGVNAGNSLTSGDSNIVLGVDSDVSSDGVSNIVLGNNAYASGNYSIAIGIGSYSGGTNSEHNTAIGDSSIINFTGGSVNNNLSIGNNSTITNGSYNIVMGSYASVIGGATTHSTGNTVLGPGATLGASAEDNIVIGSSSSGAAGSVSGIGIGRDVHLSGYANYIIGEASGGGSGERNIVYGNSSLGATTTGSHNIIFGNSSGNSLGAKSNVIIIGHDINGSVLDSNDIGFSTTPTFGTLALWYDSSATTWYTNSNAFSTGTASTYSATFYDSNDTGYYLDPHSSSNLYRVSTYLSPKYQTGDWADGFRNTPISCKTYHGDVSSGGPTGAYWFYESMRHGNVNSYWGTQIAYGWEDNANEIYQRNITGNNFSGWVRYLNSNNYTSYAAPASHSHDTIADLGRISAETGRDTHRNGIYTFSTYTSTNNGGNPPLSYPEVLAWGGGGRGTIQIAGDWISSTSTPLRVRSLRDCCIDWSSWSQIATSNESFTNNVDLRAPIFYDSNDSNYYCDPNGTSRLATISSDNIYINAGHMLYSDHGGWTGEYNKIQWHSSHLYLQNTGGGNLLILRRGDNGDRFWCDYNGNVTASGNITAFSDARLKTNVNTITNPIEKVQALRGVTFDWIETGEHSYGLIAQEVEQVLPELVMETQTHTAESDTESNIVKSVDYAKIVSVLIEAIKEQQKQIDELKARLS